MRPFFETSAKFNATSPRARCLSACAHAQAGRQHAPVRGKPPFASRMHLDHELFRGDATFWSPAFRRSGPVKAGTSNGRFMESPLSFFRMQWDHELPGGCSAGVHACEFSGRPARCSCWRRDAAATRSRDGCATRFMESPHSFLRMPWDHEPFCTPGQGTRPTCCRPGALSGRFLEKYCNFWPAKSVKNLAWGELWSLELGAWCLIILLMCLAAPAARGAVTLTTLHSFSGPEGANPVGLIQGSDGNLYGRTEYAGADYNGRNQSGNGTIFRMLGPFLRLQSKQASARFSNEVGPRCCTAIMWSGS